MSEPHPNRPTNVGVIGSGNIFGAYAKGCRLFRDLELKACADLNPDLAASKAAEFEIENLTVEELLADPEIDIVINLTIPKVHAEISTAILNAGKHAYSEKPLSLDVQEGEALVKLAAEKGLRAGCAPDTFLGAGAQTARKLIDDGWIGQPIGGTAFMLSAGPESWHPNPAFFYQPGGGPLFDMGPYYITTLVSLLGPIQSVTAMTSMTRTERLATCREQFGTMLPVEIPTHYSASLLFVSGPIINLSVSFDVAAHQHKPIEIYGTRGSLSVPDPNTFGGPLSYSTPSSPGWTDVPLLFNYQENSRGIGVADMAAGIASEEPHRCNDRLALHVLEVMTAIVESHERRAWVDITNTCEQPAALPLGLPPGILTGSR